MVKIRKLWITLGVISGAYALYRLMMKCVDNVLKNDKSTIDLDLTTKKRENNGKRGNTRGNIRKGSKRR